MLWRRDADALVTAEEQGCYYKYVEILSGKNVPSTYCYLKQINWAFFFFFNSTASLTAVLYSFQHSQLQIKTAY